MKLPLREPEQAALSTELARWDGYVSSSLLVVEAIRACARYGDRYELDAREFLEGVAMLPLDEDALDQAVMLRPARLRSLDALHLATALAVRDEIGVFVTYDQQLARAARDQDMAVASPS